MIFKRQILFLLSFFFVQIVIAQGESTIKASVDKNKILIGEPIQLTIEAYLSPKSAKNFVIIDSVVHFELLKKPVIDEGEFINRDGHVVKYRQCLIPLAKDSYTVDSIFGGMRFKVFD